MSAQRLTTADLHWAAGFLEGEGNFCFQGRQAAIRAAQKVPNPLYKLQKLFGGSIYTGKNKIPIWGITSVKAAGLMMTLYSLMSPRRQGQICAALDAWKEHGPVHLRGEYRDFNNSLTAERRRTGISRWEQDKRSD